MNVVICAKVEKDLAAHFDEWAAEQGMSRSTAVRYLIELAINSHIEEIHNGRGGLKDPNEMQKFLRKEGILEGIKIFRSVFSIAVEEAMAEAEKLS